MLEQLVRTDCEQPIDIIVVPGIGGIRPDDWPWLKALNESTPSAQIWTLRYGTKSTGGGIVEYIQRHAEILLTDLTAHHERFQDPRPVCFVCHSLGGLVLKRTLNHMRQYWYSYVSVLETIFGIVFLSTPHRPSNCDKNHVFESIMNCFQWYPGRSLSSDDKMELEQIGKRFEESGLNAPTLSVYERDKTRIKLKRRIGMSYLRKDIIVSEAQALFNLLQLPNKVSEAPGDHHNVVLLPSNCDTRLKVFAMINEIALRAPREVVNKRLKKPGLPTGLIDNTSCGSAKIVSSLDSAYAVTGTTEDSFEMVSRRTPVEMSKPEARLPLSVTKVRCLDTELYGRQNELLAVDAKLLAPFQTSSRTSVTPELRSFVIHGMGGVGKTTLAQHWAQTRRHHFDAIFWLRASNVESLASEFVGIGACIGLFKPDDTQDLAVGRAVVKGWLAAPRYTVSGNSNVGSEAKWLIVFDDAESLTALAEYWPFEAQGTVLVTTRDASCGSALNMEQTFARSLPLSGSLELRPLSFGETRAMLLGLTPRTSDSQNKDAIQTICRRLSGLPLAVQQIAGNIRTMNLRYEELLQMWDNENPKEFLDTSEGYVSITSSQLRQTIATMWLPRFGKKDHTEELALLQVLSFLAPGGIDEKFIGGEEFRCTGIPSYPATMLRFQAAKVSLIKSSRIMYRKDDSSIIIHDLVKESVRAHIGQDAALRMLLMVARAVSKTWPFLEARQWHNRSRWSQCERLMPHIAFFLDLWTGSYHNTVKDKLYLEFAKLVNEGGWFLFERGLPEESKKYFSTVETICEQWAGSDITEASNILRCCYNYQGAAATDTGDHTSALLYNQKWLQLHSDHKDRTGQTHPDYEEACIWNETGLAYGLNGAFVEAEKCFRRSADTIRGLPDFAPTMLDYALPNLGLILLVKGKALEAKSVLNEIREACEKEFGFDDTRTFKTGKILYALGNVYYELGDFGISLDYHQRAYKQYSATLGEKHFRTADTSYRLALHHLRLGGLRDAEQCLQNAISMFSTSKIYTAPLARALFKLSQVRKAQRNSESCMSLRSQAFALRKVLRSEELKTEAQLEDSDFDDLLMFWSR